tara:strand:- start:1011 stop:1238 length:228 start_codon:yes stop_codon:yes gene_type:complete
MLMVKTVAILSPFRAFTLKRLRRSSMQVGDLVRMRGGLPASGIVLSATSSHAKVYWIEDAEATWEPHNWLEVISA